MTMPAAPTLPGDAEMTERPDWLEMAADILPLILILLVILLLLGGLQISVHFESHP